MRKENTIWLGIAGMKMWEEFWKESFNDFYGIENNDFKTFPIDWGEETPIQDKDFVSVNHGLMSKVDIINKFGNQLTEEQIKTLENGI